MFIDPLYDYPEPVREIIIYDVVTAVKRVVEIYHPHPALYNIRLCPINFRKEPIDTFTVTVDGLKELLKGFQEALESINEK